ncbi:MAG: fructose bisphosphate aldolase [Nitriliruptoraceae bacterium]
MDTDMHTQMATGRGFLAALDQSGGSTPKALAQYGIDPDSYEGDEEMFDLVHQMRSRILTDPAFTGDRILGAILFEGTMDREVEGQPTPHYLWQGKGIVPFVKVDKGLEDPEDGVRMMRPMPELDALLERARGLEVFGTKMRSVIQLADRAGVERNVAQQFEIGRRILDAGLVPILEPEVDITSPQKAEAEELLHAAIVEHLEEIPQGQRIMLKLSIPTIDGFYTDLLGHPKVLRIVALSGGYSRDEANERLARNPGLIASFSRALLEDLRAGQDEETFTATLDAAIESIYEASIT